MLLTTGFFWVPGTYGVDLIDKTAVMRPIRPLSPGLGYSLHLRPALSSLAGCPGSERGDRVHHRRRPVRPIAPQPPPTSMPFRDLRRPVRGRRLPPGGRGRRRWLPGGPGRRACRCARRRPGTPAGRRPLAAGRPAAPGRAGRFGAQLPAAQAAARASPAGGPIAGVYGQREPPGEPLPEDQLRAIAAWIDGGALR